MTLTIKHILKPSAVRAGLPASSKKKVLELLSEFLVQHFEHATSEEIYQRLLEREKLGTTGIGEGVAIPHCRLRYCQETFGALIKLQQAVDYDSADGSKVDLVFALLVPEEANEQHLKTLSMLAQRFSQEDYRQALRDAETDDALFQAAISFDELD